MASSCGSDLSCNLDLQSLDNIFSIEDLVTPESFSSGESRVWPHGLSGENFDEVIDLNCELALARKNKR